MTFDYAKNAVNEAKHGISLAAAQGLEWDTAVVAPDTRQAYGEDRMIGLGYIASAGTWPSMSIASVSAGSSVCDRPTQER